MATSTSSQQATRAAAALGFWPVLLCWVAVALDGFDLVVLGAVIPTLSKTGALGFTDSSLTMASTVGLIGVGLGAVGVGPLTDKFGRRTTLITSIAVFSVLTVAVAAAQNVTQFTVLRFLAGLGLGACLPTALAFMSEHARQGRGGSAVTRMMTGYHVGAVVTALLALWLVDAYGWESMFVVGGVAGLLTLPLLWFKLPESASFLRAVEARAEGTSTTTVRTSDVVKGRYLKVSIGLWVASFMGLLLVYGLNTWLPKIMGEAGYSIKAGTGLLLVLNVGAVIGLLVAGGISDTRGNKPTVLLWFGLAAAFLAILSIKLENTLVVYAAVLLAGIFVFSAQVLVYAFVGHLYPTEIRGTALGMAAGIGRIGAIVGPFLGGALVTAGLAYPWGFYAFAVAAVLAVLALSTVPAHMRESDGRATRAAGA
jgi:MFS transporter, AAHS family, benzoate transport protein